MTMAEQAPRQIAIKVSPEGDELITTGAHFLQMSKKDLVEAAVAFYLNARREEMQDKMRALLKQLDGSRAARVAMMAGMTREELDAVGGVDENEEDNLRHDPAGKANPAMPASGPGANGAERQYSTGRDRSSPPG